MSLRVDPSDVEMDARIDEYFQANYELLSLEGGRQLGPQAIAAAREQVHAYWIKLKDVAAKVTDTEVKLTLPDQTTPDGRRFSIEGVVDIVREEGRTTMYDVKTHEADYVRANLKLYSPQLNVYAHIWQNLRGQELNSTAIISTVLPPMLHEAFVSADQVRFDREMQKWNPLVDVPFDQDDVQTTIDEFAATVDAIEEHRFAPPPVGTLQAQLPGNSRKSFATSVCKECDARFSCSSYRVYALGSGLATARTFRQYYDDHLSDAEENDWLSAGLSYADPTSLD